MKHVLLFMRRKVLSGALSRLAREETQLRFFTETNPDNLLIAARSHGAEIAVVEVAESGAHPARDSLRLCDELRRGLPGCKLLLLCSESSEESRRLAVSAKQEGRIDDFVFYDTSVDYLMSKLQAM